MGKLLERATKTGTGDQKARTIEEAGPTPLRHKIQDSLDESRTLIMGAQILLGALYNSMFEPEFDHLPFYCQNLALTALGLILVAFVLFVLPVSYHRIVEHGLDDKSFNNLITRVMGIALVPFALSLGITLYAAAIGLVQPFWCFLAAAAGTFLAFWYWYGLYDIKNKVRGRSKAANLPAAGRRETTMNNQEQPIAEPTSLHDKIRHVLTEARMVLPGAQALFGFQFVTMLMQDFNRLPDSSKYVHLASLLLVALSTILLIAPAAHHRMVEKGENTEKFHTLASRFVVAALVPLALGVCGDFFVVTRKITDSLPIALSVTGFLLIFFFGLWFGFTLQRRNRLRAL